MFARWLSRASVYARPPPTSVTSRAAHLAQSTAAFKTAQSKPFFNPTSNTQSRAFRHGRIHRANRQYQRFDGRTGGREIPFFTLVRKWSARPTFKYEAAFAGGAVGGVYVYNLEEVPVSGRRRFNIVGAQSMKDMGMQAYEQTMEQYAAEILPEFDSRVVQVKRVMGRLIPKSGLVDADWQIHVIDSEETNAFVLPGGKVFVFTGILPICQDDQGLAAVLGHEIAHNVANHSAEKVSQSYILAVGFMALQFFFQLPDVMSNLLLTLAFERPGSRKQEAEADYIGLLMMAESCYDPSAAIKFWHRMREVEKTHPAPPQLLSTHPSSASREEHLQKQLPQAMEKYNESECGGLSAYAQDFQSRIKAPFM